MDQRVTHLEPQKELQAPKADAASEATTRPTRARPWRVYGAFLAALVCLGAGSWWLYQQFTHVFVTNARIAADMVAISSRVPGWITAVEIIESDSVQKGSVLIRIDDRESRLLVLELDAQLAMTARRREEIEARITLTDRQTQSRIAAQQAAARAATATLAAATTQRDLAKTENDRAERLAPGGAITQARLDQAHAALETARQQVLSAEANLGNALAAVAQAEAARGEVTVLQRQLAELGPEEQRLHAQRARAALDLEDRTIAMPFEGVVDDVFVDEGEYITPGQRLLMVHDLGRIRVEANVKETDIFFFDQEKPSRSPLMPYPAGASRERSRASVRLPPSSLPFCPTRIPAATSQRSPSACPCASQSPRTVACSSPA